MPPLLAVVSAPLIQPPQQSQIPWRLQKVHRWCDVTGQLFTSDQRLGPREKRGPQKHQKLHNNQLDMDVGRGGMGWEGSIISNNQPIMTGEGGDLVGFHRVSATSILAAGRIIYHRAVILLAHSIGLAPTLITTWRQLLPGNDRVITW